MRCSPHRIDLGHPVIDLAQRMVGIAGAGQVAEWHGRRHAGLAGQDLPPVLRGKQAEIEQLDLGTDTGVSRRHAQLTTDGMRWFVEDLQSANGTYVGASGAPLPTTPVRPRVRTR